MSIFKGTVKPFVAAQIKAREKVISQLEGNNVGGSVRDADFLRFTNGKNGWVRMISLVDYTSEKFNFRDRIWEKTGNYNGTDLSRKYILEGGTLFNNRLRRAGVNQADSTYGSNIDRVSTKSGDTRIDRTYGIRPMPGITSVSVQNKSAYGSLREATVNFYAWDKHQLEELEILFMRPGYTVWLDWGWSQYIDHDIPTTVNSYPDVKGVKNFDLKTPDVFKPKTEEDYYNEIDKAVKDSKGNYDAMLGVVKNFSWQLMNNGGFQCSVTLISRGEVIETIKASSNPRTIIGSVTPEDIADINRESNQLILSFFEKIFLTLKGGINRSELKTGGEFFNEGDVSQLDKAIWQGYNDILKGLNDSSFLYKYYDRDSESVKIGRLPEVSKIGYFLNAEGTTDGNGIEYINLNTFIRILQRFFIPHKKININGETFCEPLVYLVVPYSSPCLISEDTVSIDPTTCLIRNQFATFITNNETGFNPLVYEYYSDTSLNTIELPTFPNEEKIITKKLIIDNEEVNYQIINHGEIGNIYISIGKIIETYTNLNSGGGVDITELLQNILNSISFSLGDINDFKLYTEKNIIQVIDVKYLEQGVNSKNKFTFDLIGLRSVCRDVKINSRIFNEQSTMIAIGASAGDFNNLGDVYSSTQTVFNRGLKDRVLRNVEFSQTLDKNNNSNILSDKDRYYLDIYFNIRNLSNYLKNKVIGKQRNGLTFNSITTPLGNEISNASSLLKTVHLQINGKDTDFKALIPFELEITLDGISGFTVGEIFTIKKDFLPKDYFDKNLGFIVTGISHLLQNNDWITTIKTQVCLLENENYPYNVNKDKLKNIIKQIETSLSSNSYIVHAMVDYTMYLFVKILADKPDDKTIGVLSTNRVSNYVNGVWGKRTGGIDLKYLEKGRKDNALNNINNRLSFYDYSKQWYEGIKILLNPSNFPSTFEEFITLKKINGENVSLFGKPFFDNFEKFLVDENNLFIYRFFGLDPKTFVEQNGYIFNKDIKEQGKYNVTSDVKSINLNRIHVEFLNKIQNGFINNLNDISTLLQPNNSISIEIDLTKDNSYPLDIG